ncbi:MAG: SAM-dependent chlorinase/fluorinase [Deltaproteobacteria bacterium]|nr:SAM-dependent chlorinase/fluorinase [Deltaproteobacteria bacterium]
MTTPLVTLTTDFGTLDPYVAQMKGVLVSLVPDVRIHDLSHAIPAGDVRAGALFVEAAVPRFPRQAVHVVVVDPGVGGRRRPMALETSIGTLVGPDNGLFSAFLGRPEARAFVLDRREHWAANVSHVPRPGRVRAGRGPLGRRTSDRGGRLPRRGSGAPAPAARSPRS